ncbi:MAG: hypothetical protein SGPRY_007666, partial [Prymnesium sp.]
MVKKKTARDGVDYNSELSQEIDECISLEQEILEAKVKVSRTKQEKDARAEHLLREAMSGKKHPNK